MEKQKPMIVALNMVDDMRHRGVSIDLEQLEAMLGVPVVPTVGVTSEGIRQLVDRLSEAVIPEVKTLDSDERWKRIGEIINRTQTLTHRHHTFIDILEDISNHPAGGFVVAVIILLAAFWLIRFIGEGIIFFVAGPLFDWAWSPVLERLSIILGPDTFIHNILIGSFIEGQIDYFQSFSLLSTGLYIPLAAVLPYIIAFYFILGLLEDIGYLPRLAVLMDTLLHRLGLHGYAIIPTILGLGCNVPAIMATRILESKRERFIAATLICIAIPCAALQAMVIGLVGEHGIQYVVMVYGTLFIAWLIIGLILNLTVKGFSPELVIEIPPYRIPPWSIVFGKLWLRIKGFLKEALPIVLGAVLVINILYTFGAFDFVASLTAPVISGLMGLPKETVIAIVLGFLRKDVAMGMLAPLALTPEQLVISSTVLAMSFPCIATFVVLARELGVFDMLKATGIMLVTALVFGTLLNLILQ
jgi:ferrous iron transport protein B